MMGFSWERASRLGAASHLVHREKYRNCFKTQVVKKKMINAKACSVSVARNLLKPECGKAGRSGDLIKAQAAARDAEA